MGDEVSITCPGCGTSTALPWPLRRSADEFCTVCDHPLFWAPLPGGIGDMPSPSCGNCGHTNPAGAAYCNRCGRPLRPPDTTPP